MINKFSLILILYIISINISSLDSSQEYKPTWASLDTRPLPRWYDQAKIGIFIHWGVFSVPSFGSEWFWNSWHDKSPSYVDFMKKNYRPGFKYQDFAPMFTAEFYNPDEWANIFNASGANYIVLTSKHHEGFTMWPSKYSWNWNAKDVGPGRDLLGDLAVTIRGRYPHIHFGLYHSMFEWFHPLYLSDKSKQFSTDDFVKQKTLPELYEIVNSYKPEVIWSDGDWEANYTYWKSTEFLAWLFNDSPVKDYVVVNDRWGSGIPCHHGSFYTCQDKYNPGVLQPHKWENCMTLDKHSWGFRRTAKSTDYLTIHELLQTMAETISCGGNLLVNTGPTHDGRIAPIMEERLRQMGEWLGINGEAIYSSSPWVYQNDTYTPHVWYTQQMHNNPAVYAIVLNWPKTDSLILGSVLPTIKTKINMLSCSQALLFKKVSKGIEIVFPPMTEVSSKWVWVLKMQGIMPA